MGKRVRVNRKGEVLCRNCGGHTFIIRPRQPDKQRQKLRCAECDEPQWLPVKDIGLLDVRRNLGMQKFQE